MVQKPHFANGNWEFLPSEIKEKGSLSGFKKAIKKWKPTIVCKT